uniref:Uncharacterized protein n=1 Tax=viral metagenome TaxID=1070528 RepID=A0A6C0KNC1_9ZZZZ
MPKNRRVTCKRNQNGGGLGGSWGFGGASSSTAALGPIVNNAIPFDKLPNGACLEATRPGFLANGYTGPKGLPGMSGGKRRRSSLKGGKGRKESKGRKNTRKNRKSRKSRKSRKARKNYMQSGGRYGMGPADGTVQGPPWGAAISPTMRIPCEASYTAVPPNGASDTLNRVGSSLWDGPTKPLGMMGGGNPAVANASMSQPVSNPNSEWYIVPTAGYSHLQSPNDSITTAAGTLEMINIPENARIMNPACLHTGGRRRNGKSRKNRKDRKNRK